jgi:superfamily II DNA/RNA helicase
MPPEVRRLADNFLIEPVTLQATPPATKVDQISDHLTVVQPRQKFKVLRRLIETQDVGKAIIFCNRKREVSALRRQLERVGHSVRDIHGDLDQSQRTQALDAFKQGEIDFLVATDVAARGIDIAMLPCVINYDVPIHADDYVHRIGRTGRAGQLGRAYTLAFADETKFVDAITKLTGKAIPVLEIPGVAPGALEESAKGGRRRGRKAKPAVTETTDQSSGPDQAAPAKPARSRRAKAEPAVDAVDAEVAAAEAAPQPAAEDDAPARPRRRRSRRGAKAEAPAAPEPEVAEQDDRAEVEAAEEPVEAPASEASTPRDDARGGNGRGRRRRGRDEGGKEAAPARGRRGASNPPDRPVVGMGDHVPLFMQRPVPISRKASDAIDSNDSID